MTTQYSNAVLIAILPHITDFSHRLQLPVSAPIVPSQVRYFVCSPIKSRPGGTVYLTNGYRFWFDWGYVQGFEAPMSYYRLQDAEGIERFYGVLKVKQEEAVRIARKSVARLGYSPEETFTDGVPRMSGPPQIGQHVVPRYRIEWMSPQDGAPCVDVEVDGTDGSIRNIMLLNGALDRPPPKLKLVASSGDSGNGKMTLDVARKPWSTEVVSMSEGSIPAQIPPIRKDDVLRNAMPKITRMAVALDLPISLPLMSEQVINIGGTGNPDEVKIELKNGYVFTCVSNYIRGFVAPGSFFASRLRSPVSQYWGNYKMTEKDATEFVRAAVKRLGYSDVLLNVNTAPTVRRPYETGGRTVARYLIRWSTFDPSEPGVLVGSTWAEVDANARTLKALSIYRQE